MRRLATIKNEGFTCEIFEDSAGRVFFIADGDIDADGANGQNGYAPAYRIDDTGTDYLGNGGMKIKRGKVVCKSDRTRGIVILDVDNEPKIFAGGVIASKTWYQYRNKRADDPSAYVDAEIVPYIVVPWIIVQATQGVVRGCKARVTWNGQSIDCVVADRGPENKVGELSIAAAKAIGLPSSPRDGGTDLPEILYELWPGIPALGFELQPS